MSSEYKSLGEWLLFFIALDCFLLGWFFLIVPVYPWWLFMIFAFIFKFILPPILGQKRR